jgi:hypothetical protein
MKILFVGDKPSKYNTDPNFAFKGAKCEKRLMEWIEVVTRKPGRAAWISVSNFYEECELINSTNKDAAFKILEYWMSNCPIIALGNNAEKYIKTITYQYFKLPHPSGRNRQLNDSRFIAVRLSEAVSYIRSFRK